jgi:hypothetical protein
MKEVTLEAFTYAVCGDGGYGGDGGSYGGTGVRYISYITKRR